MSAEHVASWVQTHALTPGDIDCITTVMLKILDGKCKMGSVDRIVMAHLYDAVKHRYGERFGGEYHRLIASARAAPGEAMKNLIYEKRVLAETMLSRPVMKAFKAMLREQGLFTGLLEEEEAA
ncbi:MAG: hypothetical protein F9K30_10990 [Dechloromonas sp.]|nr:MAG: hypothetical protein F9K30_10990 [Dechloromonas sp.]